MNSPTPAEGFRWCRLLAVVSVILNLVLMGVFLQQHSQTPIPTSPTVECHSDAQSSSAPNSLTPVPSGQSHSRAHGSNSLKTSSDQWVGLLHRNCYEGKSDAADEFFDFFAAYHFRWHNSWWGGGRERGSADSLTAGHKIDLKIFDATNVTFAPPRGAKDTLTLFIVAGMLQPGHKREDVDGEPETFTESLLLLNSILLLSSIRLQLVIATDDWGIELYSQLFGELQRTRRPLEVFLMRVAEHWTANLAAGIEYDLATHHSGIWGTLKMFAHRLPIFANRDHPIVVVDTDMIFMTDPAGILTEFPKADESWMLKMPIESGSFNYKNGGSSNMCSCVVIQNLRELHKDDPYPVQFIAAMQHMADRSSQWRSSNGLYTPPHGDQGLYYAMLVVDDANEVSESERRIVDLSQAWDRDLCHGYR